MKAYYSSVCRFVRPPICLPCPSSNMSSAHISLCLSICPSIFLCTCLSLDLYVHPSLQMDRLWTNCLSHLDLSVCVSICPDGQTVCLDKLSVSLGSSICPSVCIPVCPSVSWSVWAWSTCYKVRTYVGYI
jgi:hypothetical protein